MIADTCPPASAQPVAMGRRCLALLLAAAQRALATRARMAVAGVLSQRRAVQEQPSLGRRDPDAAGALHEPRRAAGNAGGARLALATPRRAAAPSSVQFVVMLGLLMWSAQSRPDRLAGLYPLLFAAGGVWLGELAAARRVVRIALPVWIARGVCCCFRSARRCCRPTRPPAPGTARHLSPVRARRRQAHRAAPGTLPTGSDGPQLVDDVAAVRDTLPPEDRRRVMFFAQSYGQASALDWLGAPRQLAPVYATHNSWFYWGPPRTNPGGGHRARRRP